MEKQGMISMTQRELNRLHVIQLVVAKKIKQKKAATLLHLTPRQVRRLAKEVKRLGSKGIIHKLRGKSANHKHPEKLKARVIELYKAEYNDFGPTLACEKLEKRQKIKIGRETLRLWLIDAKLWDRHRKVDQHRMWREPKACFGEMIQFDGSHHDWLEGRGQKLVLMAYIDDATRTVFARFYDYEGTLPALDSFYLYVMTYGLPQSIYLDRHGAYESKDQLTPEEELAGKTKSKTQFQRALGELGVHLIHALSPQAKGRIERLFRTFQDRLVKEMRLAGIQTKEEANLFLKKFLKEYNPRFKKEAKDKTNLHRLAPQDRELQKILSIQETHTLRNDNTIRHQGKFYQITDRWLKGRPKEIRVMDQMSGKRLLMDRDRMLQHHEITNRVRLSQNKKEPSMKLSKRKPLVSAFNYSWRRSQNQKLKQAA